MKKDTRGIGGYLKVVPEGKYSSWRNMILYGLFGAAAAAIDYGIYWVLLAAKCTDIPEFASLVGNVGGFLFVFLTNTFFNFKMTDHLLVRLISYGAICLVGTGLSTALLHIFKSICDPYFLKLCIMPLVWVLQYFLNKHITYRQ